MMISAETAKAAIRRQVPADLNEYTAIGDFLAAEGPPLTMGRAGVFLVLGALLAAAGDGTETPVDITRWRGTVTAKQAFDALLGPVAPAS